MQTLQFDYNKTIKSIFKFKKKEMFHTIEK